MPILNNPRHERFAQYVAQGTNGAAAYRHTYGTRGASAEAAASRLLRIAKVQRRVREFQKESAKAAVMTLDEKRRVLASVARGEHAEAKIADRLRAIELDARLAGEMHDRVHLTKENAPRDSNSPYVLSDERRAELMAKKRRAIELNRQAEEQERRQQKEAGANGNGYLPLLRTLS